MAAQLTRCFLGAIAFAFVVTWATVGFGTAALATVACTAVVFSPRLRRPAPRRRDGARARRMTPYELVPDDPSLVFTVTQ